VHCALFVDLNSLGTCRRGAILPLRLAHGETPMGVISCVVGLHGRSRVGTVNFGLSQPPPSQRSYVDLTYC
jgi:hypothetical protein